MRSPLLLFVEAAPPLLLPMLLALPASAQLVKKSLLSEEIRVTIEKDGADAARRRYQEIARNRRDQYEFDLKGLVDLGTTYIQRGDMEKGQVIFEIATQAALLESGVSVPESARAAQRPPPTAARRETGEEAARRRTRELLGPGRGDLERFHGVYGDAAAQERMPRRFFVDHSCDGYLRIGAMWGDVAPWMMKSVADAEFVQGRADPGQASAIRLRFEVGSDGRAQALTHNLTDLGLPPRVARLGDLPAAWVPDCRSPAP